MDNQRRQNNQQPSNHWLWCSVFIMICLLPTIQCDDAHVTNVTRFTTPSHFYKSSKYTIDELINGKFMYRVSNDIDMDPCKAST